MQTKKQLMTADKFTAIKQALAVGKKNIEVSKFYGVHQSTVSRIRRFSAWEDYQNYVRDVTAKAKAKAATRYSETREAPAVYVPAKTEKYVTQEALDAAVRVLRQELGKEIKSQASGLRVWIAGPYTQKLRSILVGGQDEDNEPLEETERTEETDEVGTRRSWFSR